MNKAFGLWGIVAVVAIGVYFFMSDNSQSSPVKEPVQTQSSSSSVKEGSSKELEKTTESGDRLYRVDEITDGMQGKTVTVEAKISDVKENKDNVFFVIRDVKSGKSIKGVMFKKTNTDNAGRLEVLKNAASGSSAIFINGEVDVYKGNLEIKAWKVYTK